MASPVELIARTVGCLPPGGGSQRTERLPPLRRFGTVTA
jgi:hypothetical protein